MAHWIIEDHGFGGQTYRCSNCREAWNDLYYDDILKNVCPACGEFIDEDENEYIEKTIKSVLENMPEVKTYSDYAKEALIFPHTIGDITYYNKEELIEWVEDQQKFNKGRYL